MPIAANLLCLLLLGASGRWCCKLSGRGGGEGEQMLTMREQRQQQYAKKIKKKTPTRNTSSVEENKQ